MNERRRVILEELERAHCHPTAEELHGLVRRRLPRVSLGTVYRNLDLLSRHGLVRVIEGSGGPRRFDGDVGEHCHVRCVRCGRIADVNIASRDWQHDDVARQTGYKILGQEVTFTGTCGECAAKMERRSAGAEGGTNEPEGH